MTSISPLVDHFLEQLVVFDSMTFRMRREANKEADEKLLGEEELEEEEVEGEAEDDDDDDDEGEGEQWSHALRLIFAQGYSIHGDHYDSSLLSSLLPSLFSEGLKVGQDRGQGSNRDNGINGSDKARHQNKGSDKHQHQDRSSDKHKDKGSDKHQDQAWVRLYSCQQLLMKMHPLFDHAIVKVLTRSRVNSHRLFYVN